MILLSISFGLLCRTGHKLGLHVFGCEWKEALLPAWMYLTTSETRVKQKQTGWHRVITARTDQGFMGRENSAGARRVSAYMCFKKNWKLLSLSFFFRVSLCRCIPVYTSALVMLFIKWVLSMWFRNTNVFLWISMYLLRSLQFALFLFIVYLFILYNVYSCNICHLPLISVIWFDSTCMTVWSQLRQNNWVLCYNLN